MKEEGVGGPQDSLCLGLPRSQDDTARRAVPGMEVRKGKSSGGAIRVANGEVIPNLGGANVSGNAAIGRSPMEMTAQEEEITKPLASVIEMVESGNFVIMHKTGGIVKRLSPSIQGKAENGLEIVLERRGGPFAFDIDIKDEKKSAARNHEDIQRRWMEAKSWTWRP